ncbi:hypothetical protein BCV75_09350 [Xylella fastidiosa]|nr:hypothetical protein BCV75_09350 [Xylella fastidiosa]
MNLHIITAIHHNSSQCPATYNDQNDVTERHTEDFVKQQHNKHRTTTSKKLINIKERNTQ